MENEVLKADESASTPKPVPAPVAKPAAPTAVKPPVAPTAKPVAKPVAKAVVKPVVQSAAAPSVKPVEKTIAKPDVKKSSKSEIKSKDKKKDKAISISAIKVKAKKAEVVKVKKPKREKFNYELRIDLLGKAIKKARKERKLTQKELGQLVGVKKAQISKLENSLTDARFETIIKVFKALNVKINFTVELLDQTVILG
jgi:DNA-binding XRE family transcriptional regulator